MYRHPLGLDEHFCEFITECPKIFNYIDMPLQHSSNRVLRSIKRSANSERYLDELFKIRRIMREVSI